MAGDFYHEATKHSYVSVRTHPNYLDWSMQPSPFKIYPDSLPLIPLDLTNPTHRFLYLLGGINAKKSYPGVVYYLRTIPSAGALYPVEIYVQIRGVAGFEDGIYHFSPAQMAMRLLHRLQEGEGVECYLRDKRQIDGFVVLYAMLYYRSSWKYKQRAFRYCLLDTGHALGALEMSSFLYEHAYTIFYDFDKEALAGHFGFGREEFFLSGGVVGRRREEKIAELTMELPYVDGLGRFEPNEEIEEAYEATRRLSGCKRQLRHPQLPFIKERLYEAVMQRRSAREFANEAVKKEELEFILRLLRELIPSDCDEEITIWYVINRVAGVTPGLYKQGELIKRGDFARKAGYLCLEQALGSESAVTFFLSSSAKNYQSLYQKAGHLGHRIYIAANYLGLGCSGIGAYYDDEVREFLGTQDMVLYALAVGKERR